jgi:hypothetical protein
MSIWCSWPEIGYDMWPGDGVHGGVEFMTLGDRPDPNVPNGGEVRSYAVGFSNHYPTCDGEYEQRANVGISHCPVWCVPGYDDEFDDDTVGEWVRLDVFTAVHDYQQGGKPTGEYVNAAVVLDEAAARALVADLSAWLDRPKAHPSSVVSA